MPYSPRSRFLPWVLVALLAGCGGADPSPAGGTTAAQAVAKTRMALADGSRAVLSSARGIHAYSNFDANAAAAMRQAVGGVLQSGGALQADQVSIEVNRSDFTDASGRLVRNELASIRLQGVRLSDGTRLAIAGFWLGRNIDDGSVFLQFRPGLDANLAGIAGFGADVNVSIGSSGVLGMPPDTAAAGTAQRLVADVLASGPALARAAAVRVNAPATWTQAQVVQTLEQMAAAVAASRNVYFDDLRQLNAEWIGISVAMFVDSVSDPVVRLRYRPAGQREREIATWDDADLRGFILRARDQGFKVYLTLALEQPNGDASAIIGPSDPRCGTALAPMPRWVMGKPTLQAGDSLMQCLGAEHYWWVTSHRDHVAKRAAFWQSYTDVAVKYAQLAQQTGVELYSLGTETEWIFRTRPGGGTTDHFATELQRMVSLVRQSYAGRVTYDQHILIHLDPLAAFQGGQWGTGLAQDLGFDVIGLSTYVDSYPVAPTQVLSVAELEAGFWRPVFDKAILPLRAAHPSRPIVFTEIGVVNDVGVPHRQNSNVGRPVTGRDATGVTDGMRQQAALYQAMFNVNTAYGRPVTGAFFWSRYLVPNGAASMWCDAITHDIACSPPAWSAIRQGYAALKEAEVQRVFDWAQAAYPAFFPGNPVPGTFQGYTFRYYGQADNYLGYRDDTLFVHNGRNWNLLDVGPLSGFRDQAAAAGFR